MPYYGVVNGPAGALFPNNGRFALVGDANRGDLLGGYAALLHSRGDGELLAAENLHRVVLHPAVVGIELPEFKLSGAMDTARLIKENGAGTRCPLVKRKNVFFHAHTSLIYIIINETFIIYNKRNKKRYCFSPEMQELGGRLMKKVHSPAREDEKPGRAFFAREAILRYSL